MEFNQIPQILPISDQQQWLSAMKLFLSWPPNTYGSVGAWRLGHQDYHGDIYEL